MIVYIVIILCFLTLYIYQNLGRKQIIPKGLKEIPLEKGLPIIGIVNKIEKPFCNYLMKLSKKHGPIYRVKFGMRDVVVLNNFEYMKCALVEHGDALSGRWTSFKHVFVTNDAGLLFTDGNAWAQQRSFVLKTLKEFGVGRSRSVEIVQEECVCMLEELNTLEGKSFNFLHFMPLFTANVISKFVMNKRFTREDPDYHSIVKYLTTTSTKNDPLSNFLLMVPFLENNDWFINIILWVSSRKSLLDACHGLIKKQIREHVNHIDFNSDGENLMDRFLIKQHQMKKDNGNSGTFTDWQLVRNTLDLLGAGYDTTSTLVTWSIMLMGMYPEVQNKVHEEIIDKIGNERLPTMNDKACLDYTQAVMDEVMRVSSVVPLGLLHRIQSDISVNGYFIPKDTLVIPNIFACHVDPNIWEKPFEFYPEHFLHLADNGVCKYKPREELIIFSLGKRQCIGESLARTEYFIFYTSILQRFQVSLCEEKSDFDIFHANDGIIRTHDLQDLILKRRQEYIE